MNREVEPEPPLKLRVKDLETQLFGRKSEQRRGGEDNSVASANCVLNFGLAAAG